MPWQYQRKGEGEYQRAKREAGIVKDQQIAEMRAQGMTFSKIAEHFGITNKRIHQRYLRHIRLIEEGIRK